MGTPNPTAYIRVGGAVEVPVSRLAVLAEWVWLAPFWAWCLGAPLPSCPHSTHDPLGPAQPLRPTSSCQGDPDPGGAGNEECEERSPYPNAVGTDPTWWGFPKAARAFFLPWLSTPGPQGPTLFPPSCSDCKDPQTHAQELLVFLAPRPGPEAQKLWLVNL